jgi:hypothetical protein
LVVRRLLLGERLRTFGWKIEKAWAGTCRKLTVKLNDDTEKTALFQFK